MSKKNLPFIFLGTLVAILLFIFGVRYGQQVEKVNKAVSAFANISPSPTPIPTVIPLAFSDYSHVGCNISFLLSNDLEKTSESSASALFSTRDKKLGVALSCEKKNFVKGKDETSVTINKTLRTYEMHTNDTASYRFYHPNTGMVVTVTIAKQYLPLIQKSLLLIY